jgi:signal transduction histidine kinase
VAHVQEAERRRIGRELHDVVGQALTAVKLCLETAQRLSTKPAMRRDLHDAMAIVEQALHEIRDFAVTLRPPILDDFGLVAALRWHVDREARRSGFQANLVIDEVDHQIPPEIETVCYRITQEALSNVGRHARATRVDVELRTRAGMVHLRIRDDGRGFRAAAVQRNGNGEHLGIIGMRERAALVGGRLRVASSTAGTTVWARLPIPRRSRGR